MKNYHTILLQVTTSILLLLTISIQVRAQVGNLLWEEEFENLDNWIPEYGNGSWGWGNGELEFYKPENAEVAEIPDEPGSFALKITAKEESGPDIVDQWGNPLYYTSARLNTKSKVSIKYGMIETRVNIPDINLGGWPAVWMLGTSNYAWPRCGEIDMMEMGYNKAFRDLHDEHNGGNGQNNSTVNQMVGANAIFYSEDAITPGNPSGAASFSWDPNDEFCRPYYNYNPSLVNRFLIYRIYWDDESMRFTVEDQGVEYDLYTEPFYMDSVSDEFQHPFYLIANFAIGGAFTDAYNLGNPGSGLPVSMPFPAEMYVDYIKVYEWNGKGEVHVGPPDFQSGEFGIFTDETIVDNGLFTEGMDAEIYVWEGTLSEGSIPPFEGENGLSFVTNGLGWFGAGIMSVQPVNLFNFGDGFLKFRIKIPANVSFQIGIIDAWGNQNYVGFPANQTTYGLVRNGDWGQAAIPVADIRGELIDLRMLSYEFVILEVNGTSCEFAVDDIYWEGGVSTGITHTINLPAGWSGLSSYVMPENSDIEPIFGSILDEIEIVLTEDKIFYPAYNINTIGNWKQHSAYKVKTNTKVDLGITGLADGKKAVQLSEGWNLIPVISSCPVNVEALFAPVVADLNMVKEVAGYGIYWPAMGINSLRTLNPGNAYYVAMAGSGAVTFEDCEKSAAIMPHFEFPTNTAWNPLQKTAANHVIGIMESAMVDFAPRDYIGVFTTDGFCAGQIIIDKPENQHAMIAFGKDNFGEQMQGFETGERFSFKLYKTATEEEFEIIPEFDLSMPGADGLFADNGISIITGFKNSDGFGAAGFSSNNIVVYPNPTKGSFTISGITTDSQIEIFDMQGRVIKTDVSNAEQGRQFNLTWSQPGIYIIRIQSGEAYIYKKLILRN
jgi:beta-glucanase (GH16 family)